MEFDVVTVGGATFDIFLSIQEANKHFRFNNQTHELSFKLGDKIPVDSASFSLGGGASNVAVGLKRLGFNVGLVAEIGSDEFSQKILKWLEDEEVNHSLVKKTKGAPSSFSLIITFAGDRTIFTEKVEREHDFSFEGISSKWVYLSGMGKKWEGAYSKVLEFVKKTGAKLAFNPGNSQLDEGLESISEILKYTDILFVNKEEAETISKITRSTSSGQKSNIDDMKRLLSEVKSLGPKVVVITDGENGSYAMSEKGEFLEKGIVHIDVVGRTGTGDAYSSGFLGAILSGEDVEHAMNWGTANAASVIGKIGAENGLLRIDEIKKHHA